MWWYHVNMKLSIELDREADGRWIAEVLELNILLYGNSKDEAVLRAQSAAVEIVLDRISRAELPPEFAEFVKMKLRQHPDYVHETSAR